MFHKFSNITLGIVLTVLTGLYLVLGLFGNQNRSSSFRADLVDFQEEKVNKILISKSGKTLEIQKEGESWQLSLPSGKKVPALNSTVENALSNLTALKPSRVAARSAEKWSEFQVDSTGTRVQLFQEGKTALDVVLGRFGMKAPQQSAQQNPYARQQQKFYTYARLFDEEEVYACNDFMSFAYQTDPAAFRNKQLLQLNRDSVYQVGFVLPDDQGFSLNKADDYWVIENSPADSAAVASFLGGVSYLNGSAFADDVTPEQLGKPYFKVYVNEKGKDAPYSISAWQHPVHQWVIQSSMNESSLFADPTGNLVDKLKKEKVNFVAEMP